MAKSKRSCYLCNARYEYCDCNRQPAFMATFCSENCRDIFKSLSSYGTGNISAESCKELLDCCDMSNKDSYKESVRNIIEKIYATPVATIKEPEIVVEIDEPVMEPIVEEHVEEVIPNDVPDFERKNKKRKHEVVIEDIQ